MKANDRTTLMIDPAVVAVLCERARRARSDAMHNLFIRLFDKLTPKLNFRPWGAHWG